MFIDPARFAFTADLEANWECIRDEFLALPQESFDPWVQTSMHGRGWSVYGLFAEGSRIDGACARCPRTTEILQRIDGLSLTGFSRLAPHTHIRPHVGWAASVYRLHLGLVVPAGCTLRVAAQTRPWQEGRCLIFDDTIEHEAWNASDQMRGTLLLDFLRPGVRDFQADRIPDEVRRYAERVKRK